MQSISGCCLRMGGCLSYLPCAADEEPRYVVATIVSAYYIGLLVFCSVPTTGPCYLSALRNDGNYMEAAQSWICTCTEFEWEPQGTDYFIFAPCIHLTPSRGDLKRKPIAVAMMSDGLECEQAAENVLTDNRVWLTRFGCKGGKNQRIMQL